MGGDKDGEPLYMAPWMLWVFCRGEQGKKRKSYIVDDDNDEDSKPWPQFIVLSSQDNYKPLTKISPFVLEKWIKCVAGAVTNVTKTKSGDLLIECYRKTQSINLQTANKILDTEILATPDRTLNYCKEIVRDRDRTLMELPEEEICEELKIKKQGNTIKLNTYLITFETPSIPQKLNVGPFRMKVDLYIPNPTRCFQCQKFGHGKQSCRSHAKCYRCSEDDHDGLTCDKPIKCANSNLDHMSSSKECPVYLKEKQIQQIKVEKKISYFDARRQVTVSNDSQPASTMSYACAAKRQYTSAETQTTLAWPPASDVDRIICLLCDYICHYIFPFLLFGHFFTHRDRKHYDIKVVESIQFVCAGNSGISRVCKSNKNKNNNFQIFYFSILCIRVRNSD